jgi:signal transduction histidine kinase
MKQFTSLSFCRSVALRGVLFCVLLISVAVIRHGLRGELLWILLATGTAAICLSWLFCRRYMQLINTLSAPLQRFHAGDLTARVPISTRGDEFDHLGELINEATGETMRMTLTLRAATDSLAHDLKSPLTRLKSRIELAMMRDPGADQSGILDETLCDVDGLLTMIQGMLQVVRAEATPTASFEIVPLEEIVRNATETYQPVAEDRHQQFSTKLAHSFVAGSRALLTQAVANLIDNSIKYTPDGGSINVAMSERDDKAVIVVSDSGPGIASVDRERALARFVRLEEATGLTSTTRGVGLGLNLVSAIARVHKGSFKLGNNEPGLIAELTIPLAAFATPL